MSERGPSYLTGLDVSQSSDLRRNELFFDDPVCGAYGVAAYAKQRLDRNVWEKHRVASALAGRTARGIKQAVLIVTQRPEAIPTDMAAWSFFTVDELLALTPSSPLEMIEEGLLNLSRRLAHPAEQVRIAPQDCWLVYAHDAASLAYVAEQLCELGFLKHRGSDPNTSYSTQLYSIQARGWEKIASLRTAANAARRQAFVAMWFSPETEDYYLGGIVPAVESDGTKCVRIDLKEHNNKICDEIVLEIRRSKFVVADFTGNRGGVYFEAGLAYGLGLPVIWTVREDHLPQVHFDTRQYNHLVYKSKDELRDKLTHRIRATIP
jgi:nucleoside 2-deoxyribosyltransferase